ncbi:enoyl-CoA hydratase/isomerase family protein [Shewanella livingstonensis]|uniref:Enoyl-CoA hydratase/isomerase family protein n=1 Tax=Shewanella livingstonensis TaxID=150120 RepID=A0A3G8LX60_9GAMM|nr:enoyl-CoA hydratase/isomerase family protein [Shewanella livingstonensis]AZG73482.1 enoyl-CoA hydratase/isomerase family protein [Shewanella livingstonensis]
MLMMLFGGFAYSKESTFIAPHYDLKNIEVSIEQSVLILRINTPPRNAVSIQTLSEINTGLDIAEQQQSIGSIIITGTDQVFSAGAGGESLQKGLKNQLSHAYIARKLFQRIEAFPKPIIAIIKGVSAGGGNELAMACDIRIAGESATFRQHELQAGLIPGFGGMQRLQRIVGSGRAMEIMLTGRIVSADEALSIGLVSAIFPDTNVVAQGVALAQHLNDNLDKHALAVFKKRMSESYDETYRTALHHDQQAFDEIAASDEAHAAIIKFIEKQKK